MKIGVYAGHINIYNYVQELLNRLDQLQGNNDITVFLHPEQEPVNRFPGINYINLPRYSKKHLLLNSYHKTKNHKAFKKALFESKIEFLWLMTEYIFEEIPVPYIFTLWDLAFREQPYFPELNVGHRGTQWTSRDVHTYRNCGRASYIITGTERGKADLSFYYRIKEERIKRIPFPAPALNRHNTPYSIIKDKNYIFVPCRFHPHKNHITILLALAHLKHNLNQVVNAVFTGNGSTLEYVKSTAMKLGIDKQLSFIGFVDRNELQSLYQNAIALVFPTFVGPDNLPPLEAFALGCPVIASRIPGSEEQLGENAILFDPKSEIELALAINKLSTDEQLRQKLIDRGYERAGQWTYKDYLLAVEAIFEEFKPYRRTWNHIAPY